MVTSTEADERFNLAMQVLEGEENEADATATTAKTKLDKIHKALGPVSDDMIVTLGSFLQHHSKETIDAVRADEGGTPQNPVALSQMVLLDAFSLGACIGRKLAVKFVDPRGGE